MATIVAHVHPDLQLFSTPGSVSAFLCLTVAKILFEMYYSGSIYIYIYIYMYVYIYIYIYSSFSFSHEIRHVQTLGRATTVINNIAILNKFPSKRN